MKKQTAALREVNNTRLKVYEQLEVSVQDLERANHHLVIENTSDKKLIKRYLDGIFLFLCFPFLFLFQCCSSSINRRETLLSGKEKDEKNL